MNKKKLKMGDVSRCKNLRKWFVLRFYFSADVLHDVNMSINWKRWNIEWTYGGGMNSLSFLLLKSVGQVFNWTKDILKSEQKTSGNFRPNRLQKAGSWPVKITEGCGFVLWQCIKLKILVKEDLQHKLYNMLGPIPQNLDLGLIDANRSTARYTEPYIDTLRRQKLCL